MKKILPSALTLLLALAMFSCGGEDKAAQAKQEKEIATLDSLSREADASIENVESSRKEADAAMDDLMKEFETK
ncbi:MAG: hypothetical protein H6581_23350 [Bacteroidia bacterium]|nr:hypothetical protein [Bacteroidia bacterium]